MESSKKIVHRSILKQFVLYKLELSRMYTKNSTYLNLNEDLVQYNRNPSVAFVKLFTFFFYKMMKLPVFFTLFCSLVAAKSDRHYFGENGTLPKTMVNLGTVNVAG